jgi:predicted AAA+ superfamily ATPase
MVDSGLLCHLDNVSPVLLAKDRDRLIGPLESFVAMELKKLARYAPSRPVVHHLRSVKQLGVDFVLEAKGGDVIGIEVKTSKAIGASDLKGLKFLAELAEDKFKLGVVLYCGSTVERLAGNLWSIPISALWH